MKLVVDLNDEVYNNIVIKNEYTDRDIIAVHNALMVAERIPEGHGRLIDADDVKENHRRWIGYLDEDMIARLNIAIDKHVTTIIEADKGGPQE